MTKKELKKMSRSELIGLLLDENEERPEKEVLTEEMERLRYQKRFRQALKKTIEVIVVVAAAAVLVAVLLLPVLRIYGHSMNNTLEDGDVVLSVKGSSFDTGDVIAFYYNNKLLVKRVIGNPGDWINIEEDGTVYVNQQPLDEPYIDEKAYGECNIELPYQVPEGRVFVMGDNRGISIDSRNTAVGCITEEQIAGKLVFRVWPLKELGVVH